MTKQALHSKTIKSQIHGLAPAEDRQVYLTGYVLLLVSFALFALTDLLQADTEDRYFMAFVIHYAIAIGYAIYLTATGSCGLRRSWRKHNIAKTAIVLNLFLISSFSLNRVVEVFDQSATWLSVVIVVTSGVSLACHLRSMFPKWTQRLLDLGSGCALILYLYSALVIGKGYIYGSIGLIAIGVGGHMFVPAFFLTWYILRCVHQYNAEGWDGIKWIISGAVAVTLYVAAFVTEWVIRTERIDKLANESVLYPGTELPVWVKVGQSVKHDWVSQRILKNEMVYTSPFETGGFLNGRWQEDKKHDPLVLIANMFAKVDMTVEDRVKVLDALNESRNSSEERLWSGSNLVTSYVVTDVDLFPEYRIAYTEKYLNIRNSSSWSQQEAIYSFQLPEGSVVTSLSLWINGKEEKAILTSKGKATEAYKTIVGVEARDPSVIHWREGNTVSMRVFPCTPQEERKVKIGITSPLIATNGKLKYQPITFEGPPVEDVREIIRVRNLGASQISGLDQEFRRTENDEYLREADHDPEFAFELADVPLSKGRFFFAGHSYHMEQHAYDFVPVSKPILFLDVNKTWTKAEVDEIRALLLGFKAFVFHENELKEITEENWSELIDMEITKNFSLFPYHLLKDLDRSVVITKGDDFTPLLSDLDESKFADGIVKFFKRRRPVKVYNLGNKVSTFTGTLRELRAINFAHGDVSQLKSWLTKGEFPITREDDDHIVLHDANLVVARTKGGESSSDAPDHLARLFAYNQIMKKVGSSYFQKTDFPDDLVKEARKAYVVSPVSSLIVLETQQDYDRFGIADDGESLLNAKKNSSGAVPEPHEWVLIGVCLAMMTWMVVKRQKRLMLWNKND